MQCSLLVYYSLSLQNKRVYVKGHQKQSPSQDFTAAIAPDLPGSWCEVLGRWGQWDEEKLQT